MRKITLFTFIMILLVSTQAYAICDHIYLQEISSYGTTLSSNAGKIWIADPSASAVGWDVNDDVVMCGDGVMINHDQNERIAVTRIQ